VWTWAGPRSHFSDTTHESNN